MGRLILARDRLGIKPLYYDATPERVRFASTLRAIFHPATVESMLANPNKARTTLGSNALWQLATLEMWLQAQEIRS